MSEHRHITYEEVVAAVDPITNWSKFAVHPIADRLLWVMANYCRIHPNLMTLLALALGIAAAFCYSSGTWVGMLWGALLFYASFALDTIDGAMARLTGMTSSVGAWLDLLVDVLRSGLVGAAFAIGCYRMSPQLSTLFLGFGVVVLGLLFYLLGMLNAQLLGQKPNEMIARGGFFGWLEGKGFARNPFGLADYEALYLIIFPVLGRPVLGMCVALCLGASSRLVLVLMTWRQLSRRDRQASEQSQE